MNTIEEQQKQHQLITFYFQIETLKRRIDNLEDIKESNFLNITRASETLMLYLKTLRMKYKEKYNSNLPSIMNNDDRSNIPEGFTYENLVKNIIVDLAALRKNYEYVIPLYDTIFYLDEETLINFEELI